MKDIGLLPKTLFMRWPTIEWITTGAGKTFCTTILNVKSMQEAPLSL